MSILDSITGRKPTAAADAEERSELDRLASIVDKHVGTYRAAGEALATIRDRKLYRFVAATFEEYCRERWQMSPQHANRIMAAAGVAQNLEPSGSVPARESQARPLAAMAPADQVAAWTVAKELAGHDQPTAGLVAAAADQVAPRVRKTVGGRKRKPIRLRVPSGIVIIEPGRGFSSVEETLSDALKTIANRRAA